MDPINEASRQPGGLSLGAVLSLLASCSLGFLLGWLVFAGPGKAPGAMSGDTVVALGQTAPPQSTPATQAVADDSLQAPLAVDISARLGSLPWENEEDYVKYMLANTDEKEAFLRARYKLAMGYTETHELEGNAVEGFLRTPREDFVRARNAGREYEDTWMPIGYGATITDPDVVSMMTTTLALEPGQKVLEIGTGSGYQSAILSNICNRVYSIEIIEPLQIETDALYTELSTRYPQYKNIHRRLGDGYYGWEEAAPFDRIIVTCAIDHLPPPLLKQLAPDGIMVVPLGPPGRQHIMEVKKTSDDQGRMVLKRRDVYNGMQVKFIPFRDESGSSYSGKVAD